MLQERIIFGNYNGKPLAWIPIYKRGTPIYILEEPIKEMAYDHHNQRYENSEIRKFLIEDFLPNAFTEQERQQLVPHKDANNDLVFLLHFYELRNFFNMNRKIYKEKSYWWLQGHLEANKLRSGTAGAVCLWGLTADRMKEMHCGVRPCIEFATS